MNHHYRDITDKLGEPVWWDEHAVPRYCEFSPVRTANIYAEEVALVEIACQDCAERFLVCMSVGVLDDDLGELVRTGDLHYGDPPNANCCPAGPTMNSVPLRVVEFWARSLEFDWERQPELERAIDCEQAA